MSQFLLQNETNLRLGFFLGGFLLFAGVGYLFPFRASPHDFWQRWLRHLSLSFISSSLLRFLVPFTAASLAANYSWGLWYVLSLPGFIELGLSLVLLDLLIYWQHRIFHRVAWLWRLHRVHHADTEFDASTAIRFHPLEILLSLGIKGAVVVVLGVSPTAVLVFEIVLNFSAMFNHANISLPASWERVLRKILVTPDFHRIHHSPQVRQTHSNFGFCLPWWDYIFASYTATAKEDQRHADIGLKQYRTQVDQRLWSLLVQPFRR